MLFVLAIALGCLGCITGYWRGWNTGYKEGKKSGYIEGSCAGGEEMYQTWKPAIDEWRTMRNDQARKAQAV